MYDSDYKGFSIEVTTYNSVSDNEMVNWSVFRNSDGQEMHSGIDYSEVFVKENQKKATVLQEFEYWKQRVDKYLKLSDKKKISENF